MDYEAAGDASVSYMAPTWLLYLSSRKINWFNLSEGQLAVSTIQMQIPFSKEIPILGIYPLHVLICEKQKKCVRAFIAKLYK